MKKNLSYILMIAAAAAMSPACSSDLLQVESKTAVTSDYLYSSVEGLQKAVVGLYDMDRQVVFGTDACVGVAIMLDASTDLVVYRGGTTASLFRLDNNNASTGYFENYWNRYYTIIGKANEVIAGAEKLGLDDERARRAYGEACLLRARAYFLLYQKFERLYLNTTPTGINNAFNRTFRAASRGEIFELLRKDLDNAIKNLPWKAWSGANGQPEYGRMTQAIARHVRAQVAMWEEDWDTAAAQCDTLFTEGAAYYALLPTTASVFQGAELNNSEILYAFQYSNQPGGGASVGNDGLPTGHRLSLNTNPNYNKIEGMKWSVENGGYGWGRVYPNTYLLSLYDQQKDSRWKDYFKHKYQYNDPDHLPSGKTLGSDISFTKDQYLEQAHPMSLKYFDCWTNADEPSRSSSFKDVPVYRLAETALMGAEAYFHKEGASSAKAIEYYNKTWTRAGNTAVTGPLTLDMIVDEYARECYFEGVRWPLLKRLGLLGERVRLHSGDTQLEDPNLNADYIHARTNFRDNRDWRWAIPQSQLDLMPGFGQNDGWL